MFYERELDAALQEIMVRWGIPGMAVGIVQADEIIYAKGFGVQSLKTQIPVTVESIFCTASVSKCFVAVAVMQLVEHGKIDLDSPLVRYLPYFQMDDERDRQITIRQMLSHTSGIPDMEESEYVDMVTKPEWDDGSVERYVRSLSGKKLISDPGERFNYSNIAYNVLGDMIAKVTGRSFEDYMRESVLIPAGMLNSTFLLADVPPDLLAVPHLRAPAMKVNPVYPYHRADAPASFLHSTILDMCHWGSTSLGRGTHLGHSILLPNTFDLMWTPVTDWGHSRPSMYEEVGLGWTLGHYKGQRTVSHGGMGFGWTDFLLILPEKNCAAVVLCNEESFARTQTIRAAADAILGQIPQGNEVSWMVPISRSLADGGIQAAYACFLDLKASGRAEVYFDEDELPNLAMQLVSAGNIDLAIEVLGLNIHAYPDYVESYLEQAKLYMKKGERVQAEERFLKVLSIEPGHSVAVDLLEKTRQR